jgi:hypothetical protein
MMSRMPIKTGKIQPSFQGILKILWCFVCLYGSWANEAFFPRGTVNSLVFCLFAYMGPGLSSLLSKGTVNSLVF